MMGIQSHEPDGLLAESPSLTVDLDFDVIYIVLSFLPPPDLVRIMSTCRTFNHAGVRHLLNFGVDLSSTKEIESFCAFMVAQAPIRYPFLRHLSIRADLLPSSESAHQLIEILTHASRLETLHLSCDNLLRYRDRLQIACSSLTSLKEFSWRERSAWWERHPLYQMIKQMQSPLVKADLQFYVSRGDIGPDPAMLLHHSSATLEDLTVYRPTFQSELQFPRMRKLVVYRADPPLTLIARIFPSLVDLTVSDSYRDRSRPNVADDQHRKQNHTIQLAGGGFASLDRLAGLPLDLYRLGLRCQIRRVDILSLYYDAHDMVDCILSDSHPSHVHLVLEEMFPCVRCLPDEVAARLTYLRCTLNLTYFGGITNALASVTHYTFRTRVADVRMCSQDAFRALLQRSPLTHFMLHFKNEIPDRVLTFIPEARPDVFASRIIKSHRSIRYLAIKVADDEPLFWKMTTTESGKIVVDKAPKEDLSVVMEL
ncbi:hypothetical protein A0H81_08847 [Grifola frondosa]|uniref:F-box domain-containing protein n=1 Tax=Grifola frondosa TaxID=5627 RepID=A0A1C7M491_GRIFR|nr:hypothetical protein A0H81_08847 [Grifola frondosa]